MTQGAPRVLVIDDNAVNLVMASFLLEQAGLRVATADSAAAGLLEVQRFQPQAVLLDIQMPHTDGLELLRQLRAEPATQQLVIIAFTAYAMAGDEARLRAAGCDGYISKPIDAPRFAAQVRAFVPSGPGDP